MKAVSFYHRETGMLHPLKLLVSDEQAIELNRPADHIAIEGHHDSLCQRVDIETGTAVDYQPPAPSVDHDWDEGSKRWNLNAALVAREAARTSAATQIRDLESRALRALIEQALGQEGARERLEALHKQITDLRPALAVTQT